MAMVRKGATTYFNDCAHHSHESKIDQSDYVPEDIGKNKRVPSATRFSFVDRLRKYRHIKEIKKARDKRKGYGVRRG